MTAVSGGEARSRRVGAAAAGRRPGETRRLIWALEAHARATGALLRWRDSRELMQRVCEAIVEQDIYVLAVAILKEEEPGRPAPIVAAAGPARAYAEGLSINWDEDRSEGASPTGRSLRFGEPCLVRDVRTDPVFASWRDWTLASGVASTVTVPFRFEQESLGALLVSAREPDAFGPREMELFERLGGELGFALAAERDRARLREAEEAWRRAESDISSERGFSSGMIRSLPGVLYMYDEGGRFLRWNRRLEEATGRTSSEIARLRPTDLFEGEDRERVAAAIAEVFRSGQSQIEADFVHKDGRRIPYFFTGVKVAGEGRDRLIGVGIDMTEKRQAEAARQETEDRYRKLFEYALNGILIADPRGVYVDANPAVCRLLGYSRAELIGKDARDIVAPEELSAIEPAVTTITTGFDYTREWRFKRKDGSIFPAKVRATLLPDGNIIALVRDITEEKLAEARAHEADARLISMAEELARLARISTLGEVVATITHEINQPLGAIAVNALAARRWLARDPPDLEEARSALDRIVRDGERANDVIQRTRALAARRSPAVAPTPLADAIAEVLDLTRRERQSAEVAVTLDFPPDLPPALGDRIQIQQVALNLVLNACEAMRQTKGQERTLRIGAALNSEGLLEVCFRDRGPGLAPGVADRLFDRFVSTKESGTGLGLSVSRSIIEAHGGRLWAIDHAPCGAEFRFTLPAAPVPP